MRCGWWSRQKVGAESTFEEGTQSCSYSYGISFDMKQMTGLNYSGRNFCVEKRECGRAISNCLSAGHKGQIATQIDGLCRGRERSGWIQSSDQVGAPLLTVELSIWHFPLQSISSIFSHSPFSYHISTPFQQRFRESQREAREAVWLHNGCIEADKNSPYLEVDWEGRG